MQIRTVAWAVIGVGCVSAAAAGGYLALRQNQGDARLDSQAAAKAADQPPSPAPALPADVTPASVAPAPAQRSEDRPKEKPAPDRASSQASQDARVPESPAPVKALPPADPVSVPAGDAGTSRTATASADAPVMAPLATPPPVAAVADAPVQVAAPLPEYLELTIAAQSVIGIRLDTGVSTATAKVEDRVTAHVTRDVIVAGHTAIPAGARLEGSVTTVEKGGKFKDHARLGVTFNALYLDDRTRLALQTDTIFRDDDSSSSAAVAKVGGGAVVGAILGAMLGGKKGAAIGTAAGGGAATAAVAAGKGNEATLSAGMNLTVQLSAPATITVLKI